MSNNQSIDPDSSEKAIENQQIGRLVATTIFLLCHIEKMKELKHLKFAITILILVLKESYDRALDIPSYIISSTWNCSTRN